MRPTEDEVIPRCSPILDTPTALFMAAALIYLYSLLFVPPFIPINMHHLVLLSDGKRMYEGEVMYRDFFQFVTPGTGLVNLLMLKLLGLRLWVPNLLSLLLGLGLAWFGVVIARKVMRPGLALLPSAISLVGVRDFLYDPTHHWYSLVAAIAAIAILMERRTPARIAAAGFFCGLSICFTQARGLAVVAGLMVFLWWESRQRHEGWRNLLKKEAGLVASFLVTLIAVNAYFIWQAGWARFLWCTVVFGLKYYPKDGWNCSRVFMANLPALAPLSSSLLRGIGHWLFLYAVIPFTLIAFFARYWRESGKKPVEFWARPMLVAIAGAFMLLSMAPAPAPYRMAVSGLPSLIILGWFIDSPRRIPRAIAAVLTAGILLVIPHIVAGFQSAERGILTTPNGQVAVTDPETLKLYSWVLQHTHPLEYMYEAPDPDLYFYLNLRNPTPMPIIKNNGYTTAEQVADVLRGLQQHQVRYILWTEDFEELPEWQDPRDDHLGPLRDYMHGHYRLVRNFANSDEIWERKD